MDDFLRIAIEVLVFGGVPLILLIETIRIMRLPKEQRRRGPLAVSLLWFNVVLFFVWLIFATRSNKMTEAALAGVDVFQAITVAAIPTALIAVFLAFRDRFLRVLIVSIAIVCFWIANYSNLR